MSLLSLVWIDWKVGRKAAIRDWANRFALLLILSSFFLSMLASGGINRFLSDQWVVNVVLRPGVPPAEGAGIAAKVGRMRAVRSVAYKDPEAAWKEFVADYPGLDTLRQDGENPVPGYLLIRLSQDRLTTDDIAAVENALKPLPQVEKVFTGARTLPKLLAVRSRINLALWGFFSLLAAVLFSASVFQESARVRSLRGDFAFLAGRGVTPAAIRGARASGSAIAGLLAALLAVALSGGAIVLLLRRYPGLEHAVGTIEDLAGAPQVGAVAAFLLAVPLLSFVASLLGWRSAKLQNDGK